jgi:hypothetical protein
MKRLIFSNKKSIIFAAFLLGLITLLTWQGFLVSAQKISIQTSKNHREKVADIVDSPVFAEFDARVKQYVDGNYTDKSAQNNLLKNLAVERKHLLKELIQLDPKVALEKAISIEDYKLLPKFVAEDVEKPVSAYGDFNVYVLDKVDTKTGKMAGSKTEREVIIDNKSYEAFVYGRRETMTTKLNIPLQGIVIDGTMAVDESPVKIIEPANYEKREVDLSKLANAGIAAEVGGEITYFSNQTELNNFINDQIEWESKIGPVRPKEKLKSGEMASSYTEGPKTVLFMRIDFSDKQGEPIDRYGQTLTQTRAENLINNEVSPFYVNSSYSKTSQQVVVTPVLRLPQTLAFYGQGTNYRIMRDDARVAARTAGFETNNFNFDIFAFSQTEMVKF